MSQPAPINPALHLGEADMLRFLLVIAFVISAFALADEVQAASRTLTRAEIRAMPMVSRPNRPGHFIGNTVRRLVRR